MQKDAFYFFEALYVVESLVDELSLIGTHGAASETSTFRAGAQGGSNRKINTDFDFITS